MFKCSKYWIGFVILSNQLSIWVHSFECVGKQQIIVVLIVCHLSKPVNTVSSIIIRFNTFIFRSTRTSSKNEPILSSNAARTLQCGLILSYWIVVPLNVDGHCRARQTNLCLEFDWFNSWPQLTWNQQSHYWMFIYELWAIVYTPMAINRWWKEMKSSKWHQKWECHKTIYFNRPIYLYTHLYKYIYILSVFRNFVRCYSVVNFYIWLQRIKGDNMTIPLDSLSFHLPVVRSLSANFVFSFCCWIQVQNACRLVCIVRIIVSHTLGPDCTLWRWHTTAPLSNTATLDSTPSKHTLTHTHHWSNNWRDHFLSLCAYIPILCQLFYSLFTISLVWNVCLYIYIHTRLCHCTMATTSNPIGKILRIASKIHLTKKRRERK